MPGVGDQPLEAGPHDPWIKPAVRITRPGARPVSGPLISHQVNVDESGDNIVGDAACGPSVAVDPRNPNRMVMGWRQFDTVTSSFQQAGCAYTRDGGRTWRSTGVLQPGTFRSNPVLRCGRDGRVHYLSMKQNSTSGMFVSDDCGVSWAGPFAALGGQTHWMCVDATEGPGAGHVYYIWGLSFCCGNARMARSTNGGMLFGDMIHSGLWWGTMTVDAQGAVWVTGGLFESTLQGVERSSNAQFADQVPVFEYAKTVSMGGDASGEEANGPNPNDLLGRYVIAVDRSERPTARNVYVLASIKRTGTDDPQDVMLIRTTDDGETWSAPIKVNHETPDANQWQWFGTMDVAPNGRIDAVWNDTLDSGQVNISVVRYSYSTDGGDTWSSSVPLTPQWNSWIGWPLDVHDIGAYYDMKSDNVGAHLAYAATFNGEQDVYYLRIGDYDCNGNSVGDLTDIADGTSLDFNSNEIPDECECFGDLDGDLRIEQPDLGVLLAAYGTQSGDPFFNPLADIDGDDAVGQADLGILLASYGEPCP